MSASTRTIQQPLGFGQLGAALAVVALAIIVATLVAFGSMGSAKTNVSPAVGAPPPAVIDHGWSQAGTSMGPAAGAPPAVIDHGWSQAGTTPAAVSDDDGRKGIPFTPGVTVRPGYAGDPGYAPRSSGGTAKPGFQGDPGYAPRISTQKNPRLGGP